MPPPSDLSFVDSLTSEQRQIFYERHRFLAILMILIVPLFPFAGLYQDAEKIRQRRSRIVQILNGDPAASPLGGAHRLGAPYSSHRAPRRVSLRSSLAAALPAERRVLARRGWAGEKSGLFEHPEILLGQCSACCYPPGGLLSDALCLAQDRGLTSTCPQLL